MGKTLLLQANAAQNSQLTISVTGLSKGANSEQLALFQREVELRLFAGARLTTARNWREAFTHLVAGLRANSSLGPIAIILDELPWLAGRKSDLLSALDHSWNTEFQYDPRIKLFVCGSAASWMLSKLIRNKGGLHNRLTLSIRIAPFTFSESVSFLRAQGASHWSERDFVEIFMALGGVPYYLGLVNPSLSPAQNIARLYFSEASMLSDEFNSVFSALFGGNPLYPSTIEVLASNPSGLTREALLKKLRIESGGVISRIIVELEEAGFTTKLPPFGKQRRQLIYKVWDEFSLFWLSWGKRPSLGDAEKFWYQSRQSAAFYIWSGYAFENLCIKEIESLKCALGISDVKTWAGTATLSTKDGERVQIDLLLVRADRTVTIVEIKHSDGVFAVDTELATILEQRRQAVRANFGERKTVQICLVAVDGVKQSATTERLNLRCLSSHFLFQQEPNIQSEGIR